MPHEQLDLKESGRGWKVKTDHPHLVSLGGCRLSTAFTVLPLLPGNTTLGCGSVQGGVVDIPLQGPGICVGHCSITNVDDVVTLIPNNGHCSVDTVVITSPVRLSQGSMLCLGKSTFLKFNHPTEAARLKLANLRHSVPFGTLPDVTEGTPINSPEYRRTPGDGSTSVMTSAKRDLFERKTENVNFNTRQPKTKTISAKMMVADNFIDPEMNNARHRSNTGSHLSPRDILSRSPRAASEGNSPILSKNSSKSLDEVLAELAIQSNSMLPVLKSMSLGRGCKVVVPVSTVHRGFDVAMQRSHTLPTRFKPTDPAPLGPIHIDTSTLPRNNPSSPSSNLSSPRSDHSISPGGGPRRRSSPLGVRMGTTMTQLHQRLGDSRSSSLPRDYGSRSFSHSRSYSLPGRNIGLAKSIEQMTAEELTFLHEETVRARKHEEHLAKLEHQRLEEILNMAAEMGAKPSMLMSKSLDLTKLRTSPGGPRQGSEEEGIGTGVEGSTRLPDQNSDPESEAYKFADDFCSEIIEIENERSLCKERILEAKNRLEELSIQHTDFAREHEFERALTLGELRTEMKQLKKEKDLLLTIQTEQNIIETHSAYEDPVDAEMINIQRQTIRDLESRHTTITKQLETCPESQREQLLCLYDEEADELEKQWKIYEDLEFKQLERETCIEEEGEVEYNDMIREEHDLTKRIADREDRVGHLQQQLGKMESDIDVENTDYQKQKQQIMASLQKEKIYLQSLQERYKSVIGREGEESAANKLSQMDKHNVHIHRTQSVSVDDRSADPDVVKKEGMRGRAFTADSDEVKVLRKQSSSLLEEIHKKSQQLLQLNGDSIIQEQHKRLAELKQRAAIEGRALWEERKKVVHPLEMSYSSSMSSMEDLSEMPSPSPRQSLTSPVTSPSVQSISSSSIDNRPASPSRSNQSFPEQLSAETKTSKNYPKQSPLAKQDPLPDVTIPSPSAPRRRGYSTPGTIIRPLPDHHQPQRCNSTSKVKVKQSSVEDSRSPSNTLPRRNKRSGLEDTSPIKPLTDTTTGPHTSTPERGATASPSSSTNHSSPGHSTSGESSSLLSNHNSGFVLMDVKAGQISKRRQDSDTDRRGEGEGCSGDELGAGSSSPHTPQTDIIGLQRERAANNVVLRSKQNKQARPLTRYLPNTSEDFNLKAHIDSAGHNPDMCPYTVVTPTSCRGYLTKMGGRIKTWKKRWFVFDREHHSLIYYADKSEKKAKGGVAFTSIQEVYFDHLKPYKSPNPALTFCMKTRLRTYFIVAQSAEAMRIWMDVIMTGAEGYDLYQ